MRFIMCGSPVKPCLVKCFKWLWKVIKRQKACTLLFGREQLLQLYCFVLLLLTESFYFIATQLRAENAHLLEEVEQLKRELERQRGANERLRGDLGKVDENRKQVDHELKSLRENRGKILRGLNTQTEIAFVQFERDFEYLKKQLQAKDEIISVQERRIVSLTEANCTLRSGLQELQGLPKHEDSDSDLEDEARRMLNSYQSGGSKPLTNGHPPSSHGRYSHTGIVGQHSGATGQGSELMRVISQLDSGRFDL